MFKSNYFSAAALAATLMFTLVGAEGSYANAQVAPTASPTAFSESHLPDEAMPIFVEKEVVQPLPETKADSYASLSALVAATTVDETLSEEMRCLAGAVFFESRGEPLEGQLAVAQVVINRAASDRFPSNYCGVVYQPAQFSFVRGGHMPAIATGAVAWRKARAIAEIAHRGLWDSAAKDSLYFHAKYVSPSWSRTKVARATIDSHIFYR